jgi:hypothetical protein
MGRRQTAGELSCRRTGACSVVAGSAVRVSFIFVEVIGEALDLFVFSEGRW